MKHYQNAPEDPLYSQTQSNTTTLTLIQLQQGYNLSVFRENRYKMVLLWIWYWCWIITFSFNLPTGKLSPCKAELMVELVCWRELDCTGLVMTVTKHSKEKNNKIITAQGKFKHLTVWDCVECVFIWVTRGGWIFLIASVHAAKDVHLFSITCIEPNYNWS